MISTSTARRNMGVPTAVVSACAVVLTLLLVPAASSARPAATTASQTSTAQTSTAQTSAATAAPRAAARRGVTLKADRKAVKVGTRVRLTGRTRAPRGAMVRIHTRAPGQKKWSGLARTKVRAKGRIRHVLRTKEAGVHRFRACVSKPSRQCSRPVKVRVRAGGSGQGPVRLSVTAVSGTYDAGQPVTVTGTASANLAGRSVQLQAVDSGAGAATWSTMASTRVAADGTFSLTGALDVPGRAVSLRVLAPATPATREASAPAGTVEVFGWYYLHDGGPVAEAAGDWCPIKEDRAVAGVVVPRSIGFGIHCKDVNQAEVALQQQCRSFEARMGLSDDPYDTAPEVRYAARFLVDGVERFHQPEMAPGQVWDVRLDLTGAQRLRMEVPHVSGLKGLVILGGARVYCAL